MFDKKNSLNFSKKRISQRDNGYVKLCNVVPLFDQVKTTNQVVNLLCSNIFPRYLAQRGEKITR